MIGRGFMRKLSLEGEATIVVEAMDMASGPVNCEKREGQGRAKRINATVKKGRPGFENGPWPKLLLVGQPTMFSYWALL